MEQNKELSTDSQRLLVLWAQQTARPSSVRTIAEAVALQQKSIVNICNERGSTTQCEKWLKAKLICLLEYLGAFDAVSEYQVIRLAEKLVKRCYHFSPAELEVFFSKFEDGEYGKLYAGRTVNPQDIMQAIPLYERDLQEERGLVEDRLRDAREREERKNHHPITYEEYCRQKGK